MADLPPSVLPQLREAVAVTMLLRAEEIRPETTWAELEADSLDFVEIAMRLEQLAGAEIPDTVLSSAATVGDTALEIDAWLRRTQSTRGATAA